MKVTGFMTKLKETGLKLKESPRPKDTLFLERLNIFYRLLNCVTGKLTLKFERYFPIFFSSSKMVYCYMPNSSLTPSKPET